MSPTSVSVVTICRDGVRDARRLVRSVQEQEVDVPVEREFLEDVAVPAAGIRLPVTRTWAEIVKLDFTVQDAPGLSATTARFVDKLATGPLVKCFNAAGAATAGLIDVTIQGIVP